MQVEATLPKNLLRNARIWAGSDAIRQKDYGIWQTYTWGDYAGEVRRFALGLASLGFKRGDKLAVIGDNRPELYFAMLAAQCLGGISLALYQDSVAKELNYVLDHAEAKIVVAENEEQVDKLYEIRKKIPKVKHVIYRDPRGLAVKQDKWLTHCSDLQKMGDDFGASHDGYFEAEVEKGQADDVAVFGYTSGTTGAPKGVILTHGNLISGFMKFVEFEGWNERDEMIAYLPMAWIGDFAFSVVGGICSGATMNCIESAETYRRDFREIGPTLFLGPPRQWESTSTAIQVRMEEADWLKRNLYQIFIALSLRVELLRQAGQPVPFWMKALMAMGDFLVFAPLRDVMGARRVRLAYSGGAPLGPDLMNFVRSLGINVKQLYALTESSAVCSIQPDGEANADTMGKPLPGVEVNIAKNGEILIRGSNVFKGYHKNKKATRETMDKDGWLSTGDAGFIDKNGHLKVIDRARDVSKLNNGTLFAPQFLENKLKFSPYIREAVALGSKRDYTAAMINIDLEAMENWAERTDLTFSGYQDLTQKEEVYRLIHDEIVKINHNLAQDKELKEAQIHRFLILNKELDADDGEITRTGKLRRSVIGDRYDKFIKGLYNNAKLVEDQIVVTYEDGRTGDFRGMAAIWEVGGPSGAGKAGPA